MLTLDAATAIDVAMLAGFGMAMWAGHTPRSRRLADFVEGALADIELPQKNAELEMELGKDGSTISKQLAGRPLNLWRLALLPDLFLIAFAKRILRSFGYVVISPDERDLMLSFAQLGAKRMAKVAPDFFIDNRKQAAS